jgi:hypothetical protein
MKNPAFFPTGLKKTDLSNAEDGQSMMAASHEYFEKQALYGRIFECSL